MSWIHRAIYLTLASLLTACSSGDENHDITQQEKPEVSIGRLICGGHLPLAVVENLYQDDLKTFRLTTVQNHDWKQVIHDMETGKMAATFILSPLAMNLIRNGLDAKIVLMADRNGNGFVLAKKYHSIADLKGKNIVLAVPHLYSQQHILLYLILKKYGVPYTNVNIVDMPPDRKSVV